MPRWYTIDAARPPAAEQPPAPGDAAEDWSDLGALLELCRVMKLIDGYTVVPPAVTIYQQGGRHTLGYRQARAFVSGALNYTAWSYMTAYPLCKDGHPNLTPADARRLLNREGRGRI